jgi:O-antigen/teichoic acid export membrane protein
MPKMFPEKWNGRWRNTAIVIFGAVCNLVVIPIFMSQLSPQLFGVWLLFSNLVTLMLLLLLGLDNTLPRILSYILAGTSTVHDRKISLDDLFGDSVNLNLLDDFLKRSRELIFKLSGVVAVGILLLIPYVLEMAEKYNQVKAVEILVTWLMYGIGAVFLFSFNLYNSLLRGSNEIWLANLLVALQRFLFLIISTLMLLDRQSLYSISVAFVVSNFAVFYYSRKVIRSKSDLLYIENQLKDQTGSISISQIFRNTRMLALNSISGFLILRFSMLVSALVLTVTSATEYNLTMTLYLSLHGICLEIARNYTPSLYTQQSKKNMKQLRLIYRRMRINTFSIFAVGASFLILFGNSVVTHISPDLSLVSTTPLLVISVIYMLELNHTVSAIYLSSHNYFPATVPVILSGALIALTGVAASTAFSIWGFILSQGLIQLCYNNWKWPYVVRQELSFDD